MKDIIENMFGFLYTLSMGDYLFLIGTFLIILAFLYMLFLIKSDEEKNIEINEEISMIESIKNSIETDYNPVNIELTDYEKEQEETAIISYDELIKNKNKINISYDEEYVPMTEEILIKKININDFSKEQENNSSLQVRLMSYDKEEAFLEALKNLQQNLLN